MSNLNAKEAKMLSQMRAKQPVMKQSADRKKEKAKAEYEAMLERESKLPSSKDCDVCCESRAPHRFLTCDDRKKPHSFCEVCARQHLTSLIFEMNVPWMRCLGDGCVAFYKRKDYERILEPDALAMRERHDQRVSMKGIKDMTECLYCDFAAVVERGATIFNCQSCFTDHCMLCKQLAHPMKSCAEARAGKGKEKAKSAVNDTSPRAARDDLRRQVEEYVTEKVMRKCGQCKMPFVKDQGCNEMHCPCGNVACYACQAQGINGQHWVLAGCKPFDSSEEREERERKEAERTIIAKILRENPGVTEDDLKVKEFSENVKKDDRKKRQQEAVLLSGRAWQPGDNVDGADPDFLEDLQAQMAGIDFGFGIHPGFQQPRPNRRAHPPARRMGRGGNFRDHW